MDAPTEAELRALSQVPIFGGLPDAQLSTLYRRSERLSLRLGDALVTEGELGDAVYVLIEGRAVVRKGLGADVLGTMGPGDCVGEMAIIDIQPRSASVIITEPSVVMRIGCPVLSQIQVDNLEAYTMLVMNCAREISRRLRRANARILELEAQRA